MMPDRGNAVSAVQEVAFCGDDELGYRRSLTPFVSGLPLTLDEGYRLAHLPLVAPHHPKAIPQLPGRFYDMGRHPSVFSVALPVDDQALHASPAFLELESALRTASFARKIAWNILPRRSKLLHATICGSLATEFAPEISSDARAALAALGPITYELRGLFSGNINHGRLYLRAYPEKRSGANVFQAVQAALGRPKTDLYVVGLYNLTDDLDVAETEALAEIIMRWWDRPLLRMTASELWLLAARDDLLLDSNITERLSLAKPLPLPSLDARGPLATGYMNRDRNRPDCP